MKRKCILVQRSFASFPNVDPSPSFFPHLEGEGPGRGCAYRSGIQDSKCSGFQVKPGMTDEGEINVVLFKKKGPDTITSDEVKKTLACFEEGFNCTQAVLSTYGPHFGLDREQAISIARAFGSGMGMGETCGAVTGALMVIGLKHAGPKGRRLFSRDRTEEIAREFVARFKARNGTTVCRELLGCDVSTFTGLRSAKKESHFKKRCPKLVQDAAEIVEEILELEQRRTGKEGG